MPQLPGTVKRIDSLSGLVQAMEAPEPGMQVLPSPQLLEDFCRKTIISRFEATSLGLLKDTVTGIQHAAMLSADGNEVSGALNVCMHVFLRQSGKIGRLPIL